MPAFRKARHEINCLDHSQSPTPGQGRNRPDLVLETGQGPWQECVQGTEDIMDTPTLQTFIVDLDNDQFIHIDAYTVWNQDGDLIFTDERGVIIDMFAAGWWKRCKLGKLE